MPDREYDTTAAVSIDIGRELVRLNACVPTGEPEPRPMALLLCEDVALTLADNLIQGVEELRARRAAAERAATPTEALR